MSFKIGDLVKTPFDIKGKITEKINDRLYGVEGTEGNAKFKAVFSENYLEPVEEGNENVKPIEKCEAPYDIRTAKKSNFIYVDVEAGLAFWSEEDAFEYYKDNDLSISGFVDWLMDDMDYSAADIFLLTEDSKKELWTTYIKEFEGTSLEKLKVVELINPSAE